MYFAIYALDCPDAGDLRANTRAAHREYLHASRPSVRLMAAGPLLAADGATMVGSLIIVEAGDLEAVERFSSEDPYRLAGLVGSVSIRPWNWTFGNPDSARAAS
jgi:uncharacterized protein